MEKILKNGESFFVRNKGENQFFCIKIYNLENLLIKRQLIFNA